MELTRAQPLSEQAAVLRRQLHAAHERLAEYQQTINKMHERLAEYQQTINKIRLAISHYDAFKACEVIERVLSGRQ